MIDLITVRQVQDILKVDRITIYRMLQDGRLRGSKIGQQWRFTRQEVERLVSNEPHAQAPAATAADAAFPVHCIQTIQDLFSNVSRLGALVITPDGAPVTQMSNPCALCSLVSSTPSGQGACESCWENAGRGSAQLTCPAGLQYFAAPIMDGGEQVATFLVGGFYNAVPNPDVLENSLLRLADMTGLALAELVRAAASVPVVTAEQRAEAEKWPGQAANAVQSILQERTTFIERLQKIANLTQLV